MWRGIRHALGALGLSLMVSGCGIVAEGLSSVATVAGGADVLRQGRYGRLTEIELEWANIAWRYFEQNTDPKTGLVNSIDKYPSMTMWHLGDYLAALMAAREFELVDSKEFDERISAILEFLNTMKLFFGRLPNRLYNTAHGGMVDYSNQPAESGWSAVDIGRLLIWLKVLAARYPEYSEYIDKAVLRWNFCDIVDQCGTLYGGNKVNDEIELFQEGRLGYEEYAASGYQLWGFDTLEASAFEPYEVTRILGIEIPSDGRDQRVTGTYAPILTVPYALHGLEFNWDHVGEGQSMDGVHTNREMADIAERIYLVQEARYIDTKIFTARTDHQLGKPPFFLYDSIFAAGYPWNTISDDGTNYDDLALVSTRAAFGMWALWHTEYTDRLMLIIKELYDPERGWYEGRYEVTGGHEKTITASTNAMVLQALLHKTQGKLYQQALEPSHGQLLLQELFERPQKRCFPPDRPICE